MFTFEGADIHVTSNNFSSFGKVFFQQGELFDVVFTAPNSLHIGDPVTATIYHKSGALTFQTKVIGQIEERVLLIKPQRLQNQDERREHPRYFVNIPSTVNLPDNGEVTATIKDVSLGGVRLESDKHVEQGTEIDVVIDGDVQLEGRGIIRRVHLKNGVYQIGVEFIRTEELQRNLEEYLKRFEESQEEAAHTPQ